MLIPIFDTTFVTISRLLSGRRPSEGGLDHSSHRLVAIGLSEPTAVSVLWLLAGIGGALGVGIDYFNLSWSAPAIGLFLVAMLIFALYLSRIRVYEKDQADAISRGRADAARRRVDVQAADHRGAARSGDRDDRVLLGLPAAVRGRRISTANFPFFYRSLPLVLAVQMVSLFAFGAYRLGLAVLRHHGRRRARQGRTGRRRRIAAAAPVPVSIPELFPRGVRDLRARS